MVEKSIPMERLAAMKKKAAMINKRMLPWKGTWKMRVATSMIKPTWT